MSRFTTTTPGTKTRNLAGGAAYSMPTKQELVSLVLSSMVQDDFYRNQSSSLTRLKELLNQVDPIFAAKTAIYARNEFGMRSISHVIAGELSKHAAGSPWLKGFYTNVVRRADDITEILGYYLSIAGTNDKGKKKISKALQGGLASAFDKFDGYQLAKYRGEGKKPSLIDAVNLLHPKPTERNAEALASLVKGELRTEGTIEQALSKAGQAEDAETATKEALTELVKSRKIGYFALLKNLRTIIEKSPEVAADAFAMLTNVKLIKNSLVLPFRYFTAYKEISKMGGELSRECLRQLDIAITTSCDNVPEMPGKTCVMLDVSGSMSQQLSAKSDMMLNEVAAVMAAALAKKLNADVLLFDTSVRELNYNPGDGMMTLVKQLSFTGGGTDFKPPFTYITRIKRKYDRVIILSDMQGWVGYDSPVHQYNQYCATLGVKPRIISWDLKGYGTMQFPSNDVFLLAGWSEKLFTLLGELEQDKNALINKIEAVTL